jgi:hypothetical protein
MSLVHSGEASAMTSRTKPPLLRVMAGEGQANRPSKRGQLLEVRRDTSASTHGQLALPGFPLATRSMIVCTSLRSLASRPIRELLCELQIRRVVDIRMAPSFGRLGMSISAFLQILHDLKIEYSHFPTLSNRFAGLSSHPELLRSKFEAHLREEIDRVRELRRLIGQGSVLLIVADPKRSSAERDLLLRSLEQVRPGFETQYLLEE